MISEIKEKLKNDYKIIKIENKFKNIIVFGIKSKIENDYIFNVIEDIAYFKKINYIIINEEDKIILKYK